MACYGPGVTSKFKPFYLRVVGGLNVVVKDTQVSDSDARTPARQVLDTVYNKMVVVI